MGGNGIGESAAPSILVDTNIVSYLMRGGDLAAACAPHLESQVAAICFQSVAELRYGAIKDGWSNPKRRALEDRIKKLAILGVDDATVEAWAELKAQADKVGKAKGVADLWIAATAQRHGIPLLTNDRGFLTALDIQVINLGAA